MPKIKTHRGAAKRFSMTGSGKIKMNHANRRHILTGKSGKRMRHLSKSTIVDHANRDLYRLLPY